jgi:paraquat-inducible protein B
VLQSDVPGRTFLLQASRIGSLNLGSPIMFRDLEVGEVLGWDVGEMARNITIHAFVREPFDKYVHDNSRFWNASGAKVQLGPSGVQIQVESLRAVVLGGVAFETPDDPKVTEESQTDHAFTLYQSQDAADSSAFTRSVPFLANFTGSVAGLSAGSAVTLHGLRIGEVAGVSLAYDRVLDNVIVPVHFNLEPDRIAMLDLPTGGDLDSRLRELVGRGLRVKLENANILTGSKQLAMDIYHDAGSGELKKDGDAYVVPVLGGSADDVATSATNLVNKLNDIPFESIGNNLNQTLAAVNALVSNKDLDDSLSALRTTLTSTQALVNNLNHGLTPAMQRLPAIASGLEDSVKRTDKLVGSLESGYGGDSRFSRDVSRMLTQLSDAARSIRVLADLLSRHPEALIRGRTNQGVQ